MLNQSSLWVLFGGCLVISFVLSGMEAGVFALSRLRIRQRMRAGRRAARVLLQYLENPENFLWTILVGNTVANFFILGWLVVVLHAALWANLPLFIAAFSLVVFLFYALCDLLPKMLFRSCPNRLCLFFARPFGGVHVVLRPLVSLVEWVSGLLLRWRGGNVFTGHLFGNREEMRLVMQESAQALSSEERTMINHVLDLQSLTVRSAMVPLAGAASITADMPAQEALRLGREQKRTRLPVWDIRDGRRRIVGLLNITTLLYQAAPDLGRPVSEFIKPALYLDEDLRLEIALRRMQRGGQRLAIVLGRDRQETGILSLQDVLKVIFGEVSF
jgi:CBS domain containing-hemolysin-like protein